MDVLTYSEARRRLADVLNGVVADHAPVVVTRGRGELVVIVSLADWTSIEETLHLTSSTASAARLAEAIRELDAGGGVQAALRDP